VKERIPPWNFIPNEITRNWYPFSSQANEFPPLFGRYKNNIIHQNAQIATNKISELEILSDEIKPDIFIITEHGFSKESNRLIQN
jgi:hypothetical protein